jgi:hypothetical protein
MMSLLLGCHEWSLDISHAIPPMLMRQDDQKWDPDQCQEREPDCERCPDET